MPIQPIKKPSLKTRPTSRPRNWRNMPRRWTGPWAKRPLIRVELRAARTLIRTASTHSKPSRLPSVKAANTWSAIRETGVLLQPRRSNPGWRLINHDQCLRVYPPLTGAVFNARWFHHQDKRRRGRIQLIDQEWATSVLRQNAQFESMHHSSRRPTVRDDECVP